MGFLSWITGTDKYGAAQNALVAKYTFAHLDQEIQKFVEEEAVRIMIDGGIKLEYAENKMRDMDEGARYCLYAIAMEALGIKPALKNILVKDQWYPINNPFCALWDADKQLKAANTQINREHNIDIRLKSF